MKKHLFLFILTLAVLSVSNVWAGTIDLLSSGYTITKWGATYNSSTTTITFEEYWKGYGWYVNDDDCSDWCSITLTYNSPGNSGGVLKCEYKDGNTYEIKVDRDGQNSTSATLVFDASKAIKQVYVQLEHSGSLKLNSAYVTTYEPHNIIAYGSSESLSSKQGNGGSGYYSCSSVSDPTGHFDHNVFKIDYSGMSSASDYYGNRLGSFSYSPDGRSTHFGFWYMTESSTDQVYMEFAGAEFHLTATDGCWRFASVSNSNADDKSSDFDIWINGEKNSFKTGSTTGTIYLSELQSTNVTSDDDVCSSCTAPNHVDVTGTWHIFPGDDLELTARAYSTAGTSDEITEGLTYQWQKYTGSSFSDIDGATSATYTKTNAGVSDAGQYRCRVSTGGTIGDACTTASAADAASAFKVKSLELLVYYNDNSFKHRVGFNKVDDTHATVSVLLENGTYKYTYKITDSQGKYWGNNGASGMTSSNCTNWPLTQNNDYYTGLTTTKGYTTYIFNLTYNAGLDEFYMSVIYPSTVQTGGYNIYFDNSKLDWDANKIYYRIGRSDYNSKSAMTLVPGTDSLYTTTTIHYESDGGFEAWHVANNGCWSESSSIYKTKTGDVWQASEAMRFEGTPVSSSGITILPNTSSHWEGTGDADDCEFYSYDSYSGLLTHTATITTPTNGTIQIAYNDKDHTDEANKVTQTSTTAGLAHRTKLYISTTPATGYEQATLTVNGSAFDASYHALSADATIAATFSLKDYDITYSDPGNSNSYTIKVADGSADDESTTANMGQTITLHAAPTTGYDFAGWTITNDDTSSDITSSVSLSGQTEDATFTMPAANITITASFELETYTITYNAGTGDGISGSHADDTKTYGEALTLPEVVFTRSGYIQTGWATSDGGSKVYELGGSYTDNAAANLYPVWTVKLDPKTVSCSLGFYYTEVGTGAQDKVILNSDFSYSCNTDYAKNNQHDQDVCFSNGGAPYTLTSRMNVVFPQTGTYKFTFPLYIKNHGDYDAPRVTVNGQQSAAATISTTVDAENRNYETTLNVTAGTYTVSVWIGNTNENVFFSTMNIDSYQCSNIITTGAVGLFDSYRGSGGDASYTCSRVADPECHFDHNVFCFSYSNMGGNSDNWYGCRLTNGPAYTPNAAATGFAFWYRTESSSDPVYMEFAGQVYKLAATNRAWHYAFIAADDADDKSGDFDIWINGLKDGFSTTQSSGKIYLSELQATNVTSADPIAPATTHTITVASNNNTYGTVSSTPVSGSSVTDCASITVTATPESGYSSVEWKKGDTRVSTEASYTFTMGDLNDGSDLTLTAYFHDFTISSLPWTGSKDLTDGIIVTATPLTSALSHVVFTYMGSGTVQYYDNTDRSTILGSVTSGDSIALTSALRSNGIYLLCTSGSAILTKAEEVITVTGSTELSSTSVSHLIIHQGGEVTNTADITITGSITYHRPATTLDRWFTFAVPFTLSEIEVYDEYDTRWYDVNAVYYTTNNADQSDNNPTGLGHFYLKYLKNDGVNQMTNDRWMYIDPAHSDEITSVNGTRSGYPKKNQAYIILFDSKGPGSDLVGYWASNPDIRFIGGAQTVDGTFDEPVVYEEDDKGYGLYANNTLRSVTLTNDAYVLSEDGTRFDLEDQPTIKPFECYIQATAAFKKVVASIPMRRQGGDTPTAIEDIELNDTSRTIKVLRQGHLIIIRNGHSYDFMGARVR